MAKDLLNDTSLLNNILRQTEISGVVGNDQAKKIILLACVSTLNQDSDYTLSVIVEGPAGVGKTSLVKSVLSFFPDEKVIKRSRMTPTALEYMDGDLNNTIIFIEEQSGNQGVENTKIAISEDSLSLSTVISKSGVQKEDTVTKSTKGVCYLSTTTQKPFDKELESRIVRIYPDFSDQYVSKVLDSILEGVENSSSVISIDIECDYKEAFAYLKDFRVSIPFARILSCESIKRMPNAFRNIKKVLALIQAHTLLYQEQRELKDGVLIAVEEDYLAIKDLIEHILNPPSEDRILLKSELDDAEFSVSDIERVYDCKEKYAYVILKRLQDNYIVNKLGKGKWQLVQDTVLPNI